jgi:monofunctional biosynthetic peptidoglycan transglycosylase
MKGKFICLALVLPILLPGAPQTASAGEVVAERIIDFSDADRSEWRVINDGVMGGLSQSGIERTGRESGIFAGTLSLENNGGFASVRASVGTRDLSAYAGVEVRVRGDGRRYQLRLRTDGGFDGIAYRAVFETLEGKWLTAQIPFADFVPTFRGRIVGDAPPLDVSRIRQVAFMVADKKPGRFSLEIDFVQAVEALDID